MTSPIKPRIDFAAELKDQPAVSLRQSQQFSAPEDKFTELEPLTDEQPQEAGPGERAVEAALRPKRSLWRKMVMAGITLFAASAVAQGVQWVYLAWQAGDWIAMGGAAAGALIVGAGSGALLVEWRRLYRLRQQADERDRARELLDSQALGNGEKFCLHLAHRAGLDSANPGLQRWQASLDASHNDAEVVTLYARLVQPQLDKRARREISRCAAESAVMVAVSPLAVVDMAFIAWRNMRLVNRIAALYGMELGYFSRLRLFRLVLLNIAFAGVSELVQDVGIDWLSQHLAARLSARAAQGLGAGLLTARLGVKAMELCRPLPWLPDDKPRLGDFRRELVEVMKTSLVKKTPQ